MSKYFWFGFLHTMSVEARNKSGGRKSERKQLINDRDILSEGGKIESRYCFPSWFPQQKVIGLLKLAFFIWSKSIN